MTNGLWSSAIGYWRARAGAVRLANSRRAIVASAALLSAILMGCGPSQPNTDMRQWTDSYAYRVSVDPMPPEALKTATYKVVVRDRKTNQPIENGEGRIFATSRDGANTDDGLAKGKEIGTYYGRLFFVISGDWAIAVQFRRDSTSRLERADWIQTVMPSTKPGY